MFLEETTKKRKIRRDMVAMLPTSTILGEDNRKKWIENIRKLCPLPADKFHSMCQLLIERIAQAVQQLPESTHNFYAYRGGLLDYALNRTEMALSLFKQYILPDENEQLSEIQLLWQYALLSAALLKGIGKLQVDYSVALFDSQGAYVQNWHPLIETLTRIGGYYTYEYEKAPDVNLRGAVTPLMARQLLPESGFAWICSDKTVLAVWLALLQEDMYAAGVLGAILTRADALAIQFYLSKQKHEHAHANYEPTTFSSAGDVFNRAQEVGLAFVDWIYESLDKQEISFNKPPLLSVPGGLIISKEAFAWFFKKFPQYKNWLAAQNGFVALNNCRDHKATAAILEQNQDLLLENYAYLLPDTVACEVAPSAHKIIISATDFIYLSQTNPGYFKQHPDKWPLARKLDIHGQWKEVEPLYQQVHTLQPGIHSRG